MRSAELSAWRSVCLRVQSHGTHFIWLHVIMRLCDDVIGCDVADDVTARRRIVCINQLIDEDEAQLIRSSSATDLLSPLPTLDVGLLPSTCGLLDGLLDDGAPRGSKRRMTSPADSWSAGCSPPVAKISRQTEDRIFDDLISMPSPPLISWTPASPADWPASMFPGASAGGFLQDAVKTELTGGPPALIPDSFLTPNASPCSSLSYGGSPAPDWNLLDQPQTFSAVDELSFFDHRHEQRQQTAIKLRDDKLPELDLPTVTSYLDCLERVSADPLMQRAGQQSSALPISVGVRLLQIYFLYAWL